MGLRQYLLLLDNRYGNYGLFPVGMGGCKRNLGKEVKNMEFAIYEQDFKDQPLYCNKFNLTKEEQERYLQMVPAWVKKWQEELDKMND